jgi:hypothetical protein
MYMICAFVCSFLRSVTLWWIHALIHSLSHLPIHSCIHSVSHSFAPLSIHSQSFTSFTSLFMHPRHQVVTRWSPGGHQAVLAMSRSQVLNSSLALCISPVAMTVDNLACENCGKSWGSCLREEFWPFFVCQCFVVSNAFRWFGVLKLESSRS